MNVFYFKKGFSSKNNLHFYQSNTFGTSLINFLYDLAFAVRQFFFFCMINIKFGKMRTKEIVLAFCGLKL